MRKMATIRKIDALLPIEGADAIEVACALEKPTIIELSKKT